MFWFFLKLVTGCWECNLYRAAFPSMLNGWPVPARAQPLCTAVSEQPPFHLAKRVLLYPAAHSAEHSSRPQAMEDTELLLPLVQGSPCAPINPFWPGSLEGAAWCGWGVGYPGLLCAEALAVLCILSICASSMWIVCNYEQYTEYHRYSPSIRLLCLVCVRTWRIRRTVYKL